MKKFKGFTILQLILSVALLAILFAIVFVAINPAKNFAEARNEQRANDLKSLENGLRQYMLNHNGQIFPGLSNELQIIGSSGGSCATTCTIVNAPNEPITSYNYSASIASDFNRGTYTNTTYNSLTQMVELNAAGKAAKTGSYTSPIIDASINSNWSSLEWNPQDKYAFSLPNNGASIDTGAAGIVNMSGNQLLLHLENNTATDTSGMNNNGSTSNTTATNGFFSQGVQFNGSSSYVAIPNNASLNPTTALTLEAWVKWNVTPSTGAQWAQIINKNIDDQYQIQHNQTNSAFEFALRTSAGRRYIVGTTAPQVGVWYHIVATYDGSNMRIYVNGNLERTTATTGTIATSTTPLNLGRRTSGDRPFNGVIDEVAIYNRALTATEISSHYYAAKSQLLFQVKACIDQACTGNFIGPDGTNVSYYNAKDSSSLSFNSSLIGRYFQYRAVLDTGSSNFTPRFNQINISASSMTINEVTSSNTCVDLNSLLNDQELAKIPYDPTTGSSEKTNYGIRSYNGTIQVYSCDSELDRIIMRSFK